MTVPAAIDFHEAVAPRFQTARLRFLRDLWVKRARAIDGIEILTSDEKESVGAITSFRLFGRGTRDDNQRIVNELLARHSIFTIRRTGIARGDYVRVTPSLANSLKDIQRFCRCTLGDRDHVAMTIRVERAVERSGCLDFEVNVARRSYRDRCRIEFPDPSAT